MFYCNHLLSHSCHGFPVTVFRRHDVGSSPSRRQNSAIPSRLCYAVRTLLCRHISTRAQSGFRQVSARAPLGFHQGFVRFPLRLRQVSTKNLHSAMPPSCKERSTDLISFLFFSLFWAAAPKGAMSYRIGGFCAYVRPYVPPSQASGAFSQASEASSQASGASCHATGASRQVSGASC